MALLAIWIVCNCRIDAYRIFIRFASFLRRAHGRTPFYRVILFIYFREFFSRLLSVESWPEEYNYIHNTRNLLMKSIWVNAKSYSKVKRQEEKRTNTKKWCTINSFSTGTPLNYIRVLMCCCCSFFFGKSCSRMGPGILNPKQYIHTMEKTNVLYPQILHTR